MKTRIISGVIIGLLAVAFIYIGGALFNTLMVFFVAWGSYELCSTRNRPINWYEYAIMVLFILCLIIRPNKSLTLIAFLLIFLCTLAVFDPRITFEEICTTFLQSLLLGFDIRYALLIENLNKWMFGYIVICALVTYVFALVFGMLFGKHKLNERVSPKKTIEGAIGGWLCGGIISFIYASVLNYFGLDMGFIIICSVILPIVSQIGDLTFSLIKRNFHVKDFSNLIPGHGGLLDRFDSVLFTILTLGALMVFL